ncbi:MAG TPA: hypothetical protein VGC79_06535 [Polyangiaceae bacterium]
MFVTVGIAWEPHKRIYRALLIIGLTTLAKAQIEKNRGGCRGFSN